MNRIINPILIPCFALGLFLWLSCNCRPSDSQGSSGLSREHKIDMGAELVLNAGVVDSIFSYVRRFPQKQVFIVCVSRDNRSETVLDIHAFPGKKSILLENITPFFVYNREQKKIILFYSGIEMLILNNNLQEIFTLISGEMQLEDDWDEELRKPLFTSIVDDWISFQVNIFSDTVIFGNSDNDMPYCFLPKITENFRVPNVEDD